jgi:metallophosphoesterase superfamily enzyme
MQQQNVCPLDGLFWGEPQVVRQKLEVHGHSHPCSQARLPGGVQGERQTR